MLILFARHRFQEMEYLITQEDKDVINSQKDDMARLPMLNEKFHFNNRKVSISTQHGYVSKKVIMYCKYSQFIFLAIQFNG